MSEALLAAGEELARLDARALGGGLPAQRARALARALAEGQPIGVAGARAGLGAVGRALEEAAAPDLPAALVGLARVEARADAHGRALRAAGTYPLSLAVAVVAVGLAVEPLGMPALATLPDAPADLAPASLVPAVVGATALLLAQAVLIIGRVRAGPLGRGWQLVDAWAWLARVEALVAAGAPLPAALRGAARLLPRPADALALARALEADQTQTPAGALLRPEEAAVLLGAARAGAAPEALAALRTGREIALQDALPWLVLRAQVAALALAGAALLWVGASWFLAYGRALGG